MRGVRGMRARVVVCVFVCMCVYVWFALSNFFHFEDHKRFVYVYTHDGVVCCVPCVRMQRWKNNEEIIHTHTHTHTHKVHSLRAPHHSGIYGQRMLMAMADPSSC